jgi:protein phosphatase 2C family protein 2/3
VLFPHLFDQEYLVKGPWRIMPGKLSVSRSFGDICAKEIKFGGNSDVLIAMPDVRKIKLEAAHEYIVIGCMIN